MTGVWPILRFSLRRSRLLIVAWTAVLALLCYASAAATGSLYATQAEQVSAARAINASSALVALYGPILDVHSLGELAMTKTTVTYGVLVMALAITLVRRHSRVEEESGRAELLGALAVDQSAPLLSAVAVGAVAAAVVAVTAALANIAGGLPVAGSWWFAGSWLGLGLVGTGIGALTAQLSASARTCGAIAAGVVAVLFALRAVGDTTSASWLSWLSPLGWSTQLRAWSQPRGWVLLLDLGLAVALVGASVVLRGRRDLGSGLVAARPGPAEGSPRLRSALALNLRVHAASLAVWTVACAAIGALMALIVPSAESMLDTAGAREVIERIGGVGALQETLVAALVSFVAIIVSCFAVNVVTHGGAEEHDGRTEEVLATATPRSVTFLAVGLVALMGSAWLLVVTGLGMAIGAAGTAVSFGAVLSASLVQIPAVWVVGAAALLALAWGSRWVVAGWVVLLASFLIGPLAELLQLPDAVADLSPYSHVSKVPVDPVSWGAELGLTAVAAAVVAGAWWRYRTRDIG